MDDNGCHVLQIKKASWTQGPRTHLSKVVGIINVTQEGSASRCIRCSIYINIYILYTHAYIYNIIYIIILCVCVGVSIVIYCLYRSFCMCMLPNMAWWRGAGTEFMEVSMVDHGGWCAMRQCPAWIQPKVVSNSRPSNPMLLNLVFTYHYDPLRTTWCDVTIQECAELNFQFESIWLNGDLSLAQFSGRSTIIHAKLFHMLVVSNSSRLYTHIYSIKIYQTSRPYKSQANDSKTKQIPRASGTSLCVRAPEGNGRLKQQQQFSCSRAVEIVGSFKFAGNWRYSAWWRRVGHRLLRSIRDTRWHASRGRLRQGLLVAISGVGTDTC